MFSHSGPGQRALDQHVDFCFLLSLIGIVQVPLFSSWPQHAVSNKSHVLSYLDGRGDSAESTMVLNSPVPLVLGGSWKNTSCLNLESRGGHFELSSFFHSGCSVFVVFILAFIPILFEFLKHVNNYYFELIVLLPSKLHFQGTLV